MKQAFIDTLTKVVSRHDDVIVITADMGFSVFENLRDTFPHQFLNTGVTEQASVSTAAGLALSGYKVFFYAQAAFATMRCFEQIRLDIAYNFLNVKIIGVNAGFSLNQLGVSHFATEDIGLMRMLPDMTIFSPGNPHEMNWSIEKAYEINGPTYLRYSKLDDNTEKDYEISIGKPILISGGSDGAIFVSGGIMANVKQAVRLLKKQNISLSLYSIPTIKPLDKKSLISIADKNENIFTIEEHNIIGGLGSAITELLADSSLRIKVHRIGVNDKFTPIAGSVDYLIDYNGLSADKIASKIKTVLAKK